MNSNRITAILIGILVYAATTVGSYFLFAHSTAITSGNQSFTPAQIQNGKMTFDPNAPKTQPCPLNGMLYSKDQEKWFNSHRPLGVMIENTPDARPQSGISSADVVYEAVAEGGITRFLSIFDCQDAGEVGPVRSARTYYLDFLSEYGNYPLYAHVGGANAPGLANALGQINEYGWGNYNDLTEFALGCPIFCRIENHNGREVATEHTMYSSTGKLWDAGKSRGLTNVDKDGVAWNTTFKQYTFKDDSSTKFSTQTIHVEFWPTAGSDYFVDWVYDPKTNTYKRNEGGQPHVDRNTKKQITAKNVVVLTMDESRANDGYPDNLHMLFVDKGSGTANIFMDGKQIKGTWSKTTRTDRTVLTDSNGNEIKFNRGLIWFQVLPSDVGVLKVQ